MDPGLRRDDEWKKASGMNKHIIPLAMFVIMEVTLISLGVWQLQRKVWKEALIAAINRDGSASPLLINRLSDLNTLHEFQRVKLKCMNTDQASGVSQSGFNAQSQPSMRPYDVCQLPSGEFLSVQSDWIQNDQLFVVRYTSTYVDGRLRKWTKPNWTARLAGITHISPGMFKATVDRRYYITKGDTLPPPPANNHFAYAMQWFIFAATLLVIFTIWERRRRLASPPPAA
jgi:surfeit locus 1 family protein